jgi:hypothetical protein
MIDSLHQKIFTELVTDLQIIEEWELRNGNKLERNMHKITVEKISLLFRLRSEQEKKCKVCRLKASPKQQKDVLCWNLTHAAP